MGYQRSLPGFVETKGTWLFRSLDPEELPSLQNILLQWDLPHNESLMLFICNPSLLCHHTIISCIQLILAVLLYIFLLLLHNNYIQKTSLFIWDGDIMTLRSIWYCIRFINTKCSWCLQTIPYLLLCVPICSDTISSK